MEKSSETGTRILEEYLDKEIFICLRENGYVYGVLRSFDHYYNVLLENAVEIVLVDKEYTRTNHEVFIFRGENILILGEGKFNPSSLKQVDTIKLSKIPVDDLDYITL